jgi:mono/diheme cytochrome c family protein
VACRGPLLATLLVLVTALAHRPVGGSEPPAGRDDAPRALADRAFLTAHCLDCHTGRHAERDLDLEALLSRPVDDDVLAIWTRVVERVRAGEMPPVGADRPTDDESRRFVDGLVAELRSTARDLHAREGRVVRRRLSRFEYQNTMRDLLGIHRDLTVMLPEDQPAFGFDRIATALALSPTHLERYLEAAEIALDDALGLGSPPTVTRAERFPADRVIQGHNHQVALQGGEHAVFAGWSNPFGTWSIKATGRYAFRFRARAHESGGRPVVLRVFAGNFNSEALGAAGTALVHHEITAEPRTYEHVAWMEPGKCFRFEPVGVPPWQRNQTTPARGGIAFEWMEIEGPLDAMAWPPPTRRRILGDVDPARGTFADARRVIARFAPWAFRRPLAEADLEPYLGVVREELRRGSPFAAALKAGLAAVLVSPRFLFLEERPGWLDDHALACRLSYFLWGTMPDAELMAAAERGELRRSRTAVRAQVERMLAHEKAAAFVSDFTGQWLDLRRIGATSPDTQLYPEFSELLQEAMVAETQAFFAAVLHGDLPVVNFIDSDFAMLNGPLAELYGIPGVEGLAFRRVPLQPAWHRGGVLAQAAVLKVTANGTATSPVVRGFWVADRLLGQATPPPPAGVPAVDPDIRGAKTIRELLARHRADAACAACHARAEPLGFALENYDAIGGWRDRYRIVPEAGRQADTVTVRVAMEDRPVAVGPAVDAADTLADGSHFADVAGLKALLRADPTVVSRSLARKLLAYGTGCTPTLTDEATIEAIVAQAAAEGHGLKSLVHAVTESDAFRRK